MATVHVIISLKTVAADFRRWLFPSGPNAAQLHKNFSMILPQSVCENQENG
jgi:hypothetical protein